MLNTMVKRTVNTVPTSTEIAAPEPKQDQSRLKRYYAGEVDLSRLHREQIGREAELNLRLKMAQSALSADFKEDEVHIELSAIESHKDSVAMAFTIMRQEMESLNRTYSNLSASLSELEQKGPAAIGMQQTRDRLLDSFAKLNIVFNRARPQVEAAERKVLRDTVANLRAQLSVVRRDQEMVQKLLVATCRREGSIANRPTEGNPLMAQNTASSSGVLHRLNWIINDMRNERRAMQQKLQEAHTENQNLRQAVHDLEKERNRGQGLKKLLTEDSSRWETERKKMTEAHQSLKASVQKLSEGENRWNKDLEAVIRHQIDICNRDTRTLLEEIEGLREELVDEKKTLKRVKSTLRQVKSELETTKAEYTKTSASQEDVELSETQLREENMELEMKLEQAVQARELAEQSTASEHESMKDEVNRVKAEYSEKADGLQRQLELAMMSAEGHATAHITVGSLWQQSIEVQKENMQVIIELHKKLGETNLEMQTNRAIDLNKSLDAEKARTIGMDAKHREDLQKLTEDISKLQYEKECFGLALEEEQRRYAQTSEELRMVKTKSAVRGWQLAIKYVQVDQQKDWMRRALKKIQTKRREVEELREIKEKYEELREETEILVWT